jgi:nucleobase:cation symporter-1, NCS1 family
MLPQLITLPVGFILTSLVGIIIASCSESIYGQVIWDPVQHLGMILENNPSHAARFGVFFIALCFIYVQLILVSSDP